MAEDQENMQEQDQLENGEAGQEATDTEIVAELDDPYEGGRSLEELVNDSMRNRW